MGLLVTPCTSYLFVHCCTSYLAMFVEVRGLKLKPTLMKVKISPAINGLFGQTSYKCFIVIRNRESHWCGESYWDWTSSVGWRWSSLWPFRGHCLSVWFEKKKKVFFEFSLKHLTCSDFSQSDWPVVGVVCSQTVTVSLQRYLTSKWPLFCSPRWHSTGYLNYNYTGCF